MAKPVVYVFGHAMSGVAEALRQTGDYSEVHQLTAMVGVGLVDGDRAAHAAPLQYDADNGGLTTIGSAHWFCGSLPWGGGRVRGWPGYRRQGGRSALAIAAHRAGQPFRATGSKRRRQRERPQFWQNWVADRKRVLSAIVSDPQWGEGVA